MPYAADGATDRIARATAGAFAKHFGDAVAIVENRPGNGGLTGAAQAAAGEPDGRLLLFCESGPVVLAPYLRSNMPFNPRIDLTPIALTGQSPLSNDPEDVMRNSIRFIELADIDLEARQKIFSENALKVFDLHRLCTPAGTCATCSTQGAA